MQTQCSADLFGFAPVTERAMGNAEPDLDLVKPAAEVGVKWKVTFG